jgi:multidrug efflux pump subunit AcrA (membrane-fusion protein)
VQLSVTEGSALKEGDPIALIDDRQVRLQMEAAKFGHDAAERRYNSDIEVRYAEEASKVAEAEVRRMNDANRQTPGAVAPAEVDKAKLQHSTTLLQIEKAKQDRALAWYDVGTKGAEYRLAELGAQRRMIKAPFDGVVVDILRHQNEWVNPGDTILKYMRLDTMRVEKYVYLSEFDPRDLAGCRVTVEVNLAGTRKATFTGKVTYVSPHLNLDNQYLLRAEVANRQEMGHWLLRPNSQASMTVHLGTSDVSGVGQRGR